jgi:hypothetical protein
MPDTTQPVETEFANTPLYDVPLAWHPEPIPYTVTIAGPERHDGERPYVCVVEAHTTEQAWAKALGWFILDQSTTDAFVIADQSSQGLPMPGGGYAWNDLRPATARRHALDDLAHRATLALDNHHVADANGGTLPDRPADRTEARAAAARAAWPLIIELAQYGRTF